MDVIQNAKLNKFEKQRVYNNFRVCGRHFTKEDRLFISGQLARNVIPTQNLPRGMHYLLLVIFF